MPKISTKGLHMPESPIRKLVPYAESAKKKGHTVYHLNIGQPDIKTPDVALEAVKTADISVLEYSHSAGFDSYRVKFVPVMSGIENGFALPAIADFEKLITPKTKAILICNPGNPTGYLYSKEEIQQLADLVKKHDLFLIADEVYREFVYDGMEHYS